MQNIHPSPSRNANPHFKKQSRKKGQNNVAWLRAALRNVSRETLIVLIGGEDNLAFRLRVAQAHLRDSFTPSHWSHAFLMFGLDPTAEATPIYEISLDSPAGFGLPGSTNGLQENALGRYADPRAYPNVAVIRANIDVQEAAVALFRFRQQRAILDAVDLMIRWLAFGWGAGGAGNPLLDGYGLPSAAMIELVCNVAGYDITPNTPSRASTPEALWQATKWWWEFPRGDAPPPTGAFVIDAPLGYQQGSKWQQRLESLLPAAPTSAPPAASRSRGSSPSSS